IRSLPTCRGVIGVATCDKGLPAMMLALAGTPDLASVLVPGGVALLPEEGEDAGRVQSSGARFAHGELTLERAAEVLCRACATPGGGCQFLGTAATSQVIGEALGMSLAHSALAPSGHPIWLDMARRSARAPLNLEARRSAAPRCDYRERGAAGADARLVGAIRAARGTSAQTAGARRCRSRLRHHGSGFGAQPRPDVHGNVPDRESRSTRVGDQEHGD